MARVPKDRKFFKLPVFFKPPIVLGIDTLFKALPQGVIITDSSLVVKAINPSAISLLAVNGKDTIGKLLNTLIPELQSINDLVYPSSLFLPVNGVQCTIYIHPLHSTANRIKGFMLRIESFDEKKPLEELQEAKDKFSLAIQAAGFDPWENDLLSGQRKGGRRTFSNLGYSDSQIPSTLDELLLLVHPDDVGKVKQAIASHLSGSTNMYSSDFRLRDTKGAYHWFANYGRVTKWDSQGNPLKIMGLTLRIDDRKMVEERILKQNEALKNANAEKDKFFSIIAHDLKGPFQGFIGLTELLSVDISTLSLEEVKEIANSLRNSAKNLYELLDNLLKWALIKRGRKRFSPERILIYSLTQSSIELFKNQALIKKVAINNLVESEIYVIADRESLNTILRNLISNAVKFTPNNGNISLTSIILPKGMLEFSVTDTGIGMDEELQSKLFSIDQKVSRPGTANEPSTGLGLILCKELIEKHGGTIKVDSKQGVGTTFKFTVPLAP